MVNRYLILLPFINYFLFAMSRFSVSMVFPELGSELNLMEVHMGLLISIQLSASLLTGLASGPIEGRIGRRAVIGLGFLLVFSGIFVFSMSGSYLAVMGSLAMCGCGQGLFVPTLYSFMGEIIPKSRGLMIGVANSIFNLGGFMGPWFTGNTIILYTWRLPFLVFGSLGLAALGVERIFYRYPQPASRSIASFSASTLGLMKSRNIRVLLVTMFLSNFGMGAFITWTPTFLRIIREIDTATAGLIFGLSSLAAIPGCILFGSLSDTFGRKRVASMVGFTAGLASLFFYADAPDVLVFALASALFGLLAHPYWNLQIAQAQDSVGPDVITAATGLIRVSSIAGSVVSPVLTGLLIPAFGLFSVLVYVVPASFLLYGLAILAIKLPSSP